MTQFTSLILPIAVLAMLGQSVHANETVPMPRGAPTAGMGAGPNRHGMGMQHPGMRDAIIAQHRGYAQVILDHAEALKLNDEQLGKITRIHRENQPRLQELAKHLHDTIKDTHEAFLNSADDETAIRKSAQAHTTAFNEFLETALKSREAVNAVLTSAQREQLKSLK